MLHQRFAGFAVNDLAAVIAQDAAAAAVQLQLFGKRLNAHGGAAAGQHNAHAAVRRCLQGSFGAWGNDFGIVGQCAVQIQCQNFVLHNIPCFFVFSSFYFTLSAAIAQGAVKIPVISACIALWSAAGLILRCSTPIFVAKPGK